MKIVKKSVPISVPVHIHNAETKDTHYKSVVKPVHEGRGLHLLFNS